MTILRDYLRRRRVARHVAANGYWFFFNGVKVRIPEDSPPGVGNALLKKKYEREEASLISRYLPANHAVVELGGSIGVVSGLIRSRLAPGTKHIIVEANPELIEICRENAQQGDPSNTIIINAALGYGAQALRFALGDEIHSNRILAPNETAKHTIEVPATTLSEVMNSVDQEEGFSLVCDIEGAELEMIRKEAAVVARAAFVVMELHPDLYLGGTDDEREIECVMLELGFEQVERISNVCLWRR